MRRIVSVVHSPPSASVLEPNAFAVAEDVNLSIVLRGCGIEHALAVSEPPPVSLAGVLLSAPADATDLRGLVESGVPVLVDAEDLNADGLTAEDLVAGVRVVSRKEVAEAMRLADGVLTW